MQRVLRYREDLLLLVPALTSVSARLPLSWMIIRVSRVVTRLNTVQPRRQRAALGSLERLIRWICQQVFVFVQNGVHVLGTAGETDRSNFESDRFGELNVLCSADRIFHRFGRTVTGRAVLHMVFRSSRASPPEFRWGQLPWLVTL